MNRLRSGIHDQELGGAKELRRLAKLSSSNRIRISEAGAIPLLLKALKSSGTDVQAHSIAALLNLTIRNDANKQAILLAKGLDSIVDVLKKGKLQESRENAAALLFNLSHANSHRMTVASTEGIFTGLAELLRDGSARGKRDVAAALFNLLQIRHCRPLAVRAGVVVPLLRLAQDSSLGLVDESLTVLLNLAGHQEGRFAIMQASGIRTLVDLLRRGSDSNKEYACAVLLVLCLDDYACSEEACNLGVQELLENLLVSGTERAQRKAAKIMELLK
ncbi:hypothetical protein KP509_19G008100 [Ceratopteris richardii]|nr:hypothetical protein KP509_19G008100 [Ceratopteris richardii]